MHRCFELLVTGLLALAVLDLFPRVYPLPTSDSAYDWAGPTGDDKSKGSRPLRGGPSLLGVLPNEVNPCSRGEVPGSSYALAPGQGTSADIVVPFTFKDTPNPQPTRGDLGATNSGSRTYGFNRLNHDTFAPPGSHHGTVGQKKWPLGLSHNRILPGHARWTRQENTDVLAMATAMAGVDMTLAPGAYRELHWHKANEWSLVLNGSVRVQTINEDGETFIDDVAAGDVWYFPAGVPHSLQALDEGAAQFMLVFDQGDFNDGNTGLITDMFVRNPKEVLSKDLPAPLSDFDELPKDQLYIFNGTPAPSNLSEQTIAGLGGIVSGNSSCTYYFSKYEAHRRKDQDH